MVFNFDTTQNTVKSHKTICRVFIKCEKPQGKAATDESRGILDQFIILIHFHNAAGIAAVAVFSVADESTKDEELEVK